MKATVTSMIAFFVILVGAWTVQGQIPEPQSVADLRKQIQDLVAVDRDSATPPEVKALNRKFISERQARLRNLLEKRIAAVRKYLDSISAIVTAEEKTQIQALILDLERESSDLDRDARANSAATSPQNSGTSTTVDSGARLPSSLPRNDNQSNAPSAAPGAGRSRTSSAAVPAQATNQVPKSADQAVDQFQQQLEIEKANIVDEVVKDVTGKRADDRATGSRTFAPTQDPAAFAKILTMNLFPRKEFTAEIESSRVDKQVGGAASNAGSTSLVSKGSAPAILGFAVENGGLTRTTEGTTITFRGNLVGLVDSLAGKGFIDSYEDSQTIKLLRKFSFALSYDTNLGTTPNVFLANRQQLSSYSFRYEFFNHRDPRDPRYTAKWANLVKVNAQPVVTDANLVQNLFLRDATLRAWLVDAQTAIEKALDGEVAGVVRAKLAELEKLPLSPAVKAAVGHFSQSFSDYREKRDELLDTVANGPIFTVDYLNNRRPGLIDTSNIKFIYSTGIVNGKASITANGDLTFFNSQPNPGMNRLRDYDFSTQLDIPLGDPRGFGQFDLSFAGQLKRLAEDEIVNGIIVARRGNIASFNLKLEVPIKNLGIKFPVAFTYSNRTEFDLKKQLRANFGFAFDPDFLYNMLKPFSNR